VYKALQKSVANGAEGSAKAGKIFREALWVVWGVLGGSEGSPKGRKKCIKGRKKLEETCKCVESQAGTKFDFIKPKECLADG
jgi:hypothetical protein